MRTKNLFHAGLIIGLIFLLFSLFFGIASAPAQTFDQKFSITWRYDGTNANVLFLLYHSPVGPDSTFFQNQKPVFATKSALETGIFTLKLNIYLENYWGARNCIVSGADTIFSKWAYAKFQHRPSAPYDLEFYLR